MRSVAILYLVYYNKNEVLKLKKTGDIVKLRATIELDRNWARNLDKDELLEDIKIRLNHSLGFRGYVDSLSAVIEK